MNWSSYHYLEVFSIFNNIIINSNFDLIAPKLHIFSFAICPSFSSFKKSSLYQIFQKMESMFLTGFSLFSSSSSSSSSLFIVIFIIWLVIIIILLILSPPTPNFFPFCIEFLSSYSIFKIFSLELFISYLLF